jgi:succinate dehydrogenase / fumarate reductase flavoprotein subunit
MPGFYAAGECACVSVHGANRLGTNSLVDIIVFGRRAGRDAVRYVKEADLLPLPHGVEDPARDEVERLLGADGEEKVAAIRAELQEQMDINVSVMRDAVKLTTMQRRLSELRDRYQRIGLQDRGRVHNSDLTEAIELGNLLEIADAMVAGALAREESRGAHYREDFPKRDDARFLAHTLVRKSEGRVTIGYKPVSITRFQPQERKY